MRYIYIPDATTGLTLRDGPELTLEQLQALVGGGYIEVVYRTAAGIREGAVHVIDNEDGIAKNLAPSVVFPLVRSLHGVLRGPIVIMAVDGDGEQRDMTDAELAQITLVQPKGDPLPTLCINESCR